MPRLAPKNRGDQHVIASGPRGQALRTHAQCATEAHADHVAIGACEGDTLGDRLWRLRRVFCVLNGLKLKEHHIKSWFLRKFSEICHVFVHFLYNLIVMIGWEIHANLIFQTHAHLGMTHNLSLHVSTSYTYQAYPLFNSWRKNAWGHRQWRSQCAGQGGLDRLIIYIWI